MNNEQAIDNATYSYDGNLVIMEIVLPSEHVHVNDSDILLSDPNNDPQDAWVYITERAKYMMRHEAFTLAMENGDDIYYDDRSGKMKEYWIEDMEIITEGLSATYHGDTSRVVAEYSYKF